MAIRSHLVTLACLLSTHLAFAQPVPEIKLIEPGNPSGQSPIVTAMPVPAKPVKATPPGMEFVDGAPRVFSQQSAEVELGTSKRFDTFPTSLLWEPMLANRRDPRMAMSLNNTNSAFSRNTADPEIGTTVGLVRWQEDDRPFFWQVDLFGKVMVRFSDTNYQIAEDYRAGVPITFKTGNLTGKFGWEHTSTHVGDDFREIKGVRGFQWEKDEGVLALGYLFENQFRLYGQTGYAFGQIVPGNPSRWRFDGGFDWYERKTTGPVGQPFMAFHCDVSGTNQYVPGFNGQLGWMWKTLDKRLSQMRVYLELYDGRSQFGQLFRDRERYAGFGISLDY